jgi:hypothetical protein
VLVFEDEIEVFIRPERVGNTSISFVWQISRGDEICIEGRDTTVHVGDDGRPAKLPDVVRGFVRLGCGVARLGRLRNALERNEQAAVRALEARVPRSGPRDHGGGEALVAVRALDGVVLVELGGGHASTLAEAPFRQSDGGLTLAAGA